MQTVRQGDVLLQRISALPEEAERVKAKGPIVLALGEATGHKHQIKTGAVAYEWQGDMLIEVKKEAALVHEEHSTITLEAGIYQRIIQREYSPQAIRNVND